jgi:hypothetical protein
MTVLKRIDCVWDPAGRVVADSQCPDSAVPPEDDASLPDAGF